MNSTTANRKSVFKKPKHASPWSWVSARILRRVSFPVRRFVVLAYPTLFFAVYSWPMFGCNAGPDYRPPVEQMPAHYAEASTQPASQPYRLPTASQPTTAPAMSETRPPVNLAKWWEAFEDAQLNSLINRAVDANLELQIAVARVAQARAHRQVIAANELPQVFMDVNQPMYQRFSGTTNQPTYEPPVPGASVGIWPGAIRRTGVDTPQIMLYPPGNRSPTVVVDPGKVPNVRVQFPRQPGSGGGIVVGRDVMTFQLGFDATWELDVFGGIRRAVEAAEDDIQSAIEARNNVLVTLLADVGSAYLQLRGYQQRERIARLNIALQQHTLELVQTRFAQGISNELDVALAERQLATTWASLPPLLAGEQQAKHRLAVLLAKTPGELFVELDPVGPICKPPPKIPVGLPSELLRRRPDIRQAERNLASATASIGVATADLFPKFSLTGSFGTATGDIRHFVNAQSLYWSAGPAVSWPIYDAGKIVANIQVREAITEQQLLNYRQVVLTALEEVDNAIVDYEQEYVRLETLGVAVAAAKKSVALSTERYDKGLVDFLNVLDAERQQYDLQDKQVLSEQVLVVKLVALYKALGGGWESAVEPAKSQNVEMPK